MRTCLFLCTAAKTAFVSVDRSALSENHFVLNVFLFCLEIVSVPANFTFGALEVLECGGALVPFVHFSTDTAE